MQFDAEGKLTIGQRGSRLVRLHAIDEQPGTDVIGITGERLLEVEIDVLYQIPNLYEPALPHGAGFQSSASGMSAPVVPPGKLGNRPFASAHTGLT
jgi:hypothetical protein